MAAIFLPMHFFAPNVFASKTSRRRWRSAVCLPAPATWSWSVSCWAFPETMWRRLWHKPAWHSADLPQVSVLVHEHAPDRQSGQATDAVRLRQSHHPPWQNPAHRCDAMTIDQDIDTFHSVRKHDHRVPNQRLHASYQLFNCCCAQSPSACCTSFMVLSPAARAASRWPLITSD